MGKFAFAREFLIRHAKLLFIMIMIAYLYFYFNYTLYDIDTGWVAEPAYAWLNGGPMAMPSWQGVYGFDQYTYWYPPVIFWLQMGVYKILGFGLKQDLVMLFLIFFAAVYLTYALAKKIYGERVAEISVVVFASSVLYLTFALYSNRPDVLLGVWNILAIISYFKGRKDQRFLVLAGVFSGLSLSSHMAGSLILPSIALVCLMQNKWKLDPYVLRAWLFLALGFFIAMIPQLVYASEDFSLFVKQRWLNTAPDPTKSTLLSEIDRLSGMFLHKSMPFISILFVSALYYAWTRRNKDEYAKAFLLIILFHVIALVFVAHKSPRYYASIIPLWTILAAKALNDAFDSKRFARISSVFFVIMLLFGLGTYFASAVLMYHTNNYYSLDKYMEENYLGKENGRVFIAQPAFFFIFKDKMYAYNTIFYRLDLNESFGSIMTELNPKYVLYDSHMESYRVALPNHPFWNFLSKDATAIETICFVGDKRVTGEENYLRRMNHNYFDLFMSVIRDNNKCIDPVTIYRVNGRTNA